jgi:hypothetical protein
MPCGREESLCAGVTSPVDACNRINELDFARNALYSLTERRPSQGIRLDLDHGLELRKSALYGAVRTCERTTLPLSPSPPERQAGQEAARETRILALREVLRSPLP